MHYGPSDTQIERGAKPITTCGYAMRPGEPGTEGRRTLSNLVWSNNDYAVTCRNCAPWLE